MDYQEAKQLVLEYLNQDAVQCGYRLAVYEPPIEFEYGWVFSFNTEHALEPRPFEKKVQQMLDNGLSLAQIEASLTNEDREQESKEVGLVGTAPIFVDRQTQQIRRLTILHYSPMKVQLEEIREEKTGRKGVWCICLTQSLTGQSQKMAKLRMLLELSPVELMKHIKQIESPLFQGSIRDAWSLNEALKENEIPTQLVKLEE
ncbi:hypothetical protein QNI16_20580 [Cytophagaceae bacterium YF14B1]|uniref:Immunity protein 35 domain-containing protein n=1 Tax=Xanthocytophaga flava TaxID=3048013 RepID=A0AAE3QPI8_9BACT|nr:hypothetical protein [Xanthocytophaga flavus]MDJ1482910.1 hypothetical protein [Xanthocytophaga flavus]